MSRRASLLRYEWIVAWPALAVVALMAFLVVSDLRDVDAAAPQSIPLGTDWSAQFPERIDKVTNALEIPVLPAPQPVEEMRGSGRSRYIHRRYHVVIPRKKYEEMAASIARVSAVDPGVGITSKPSAEGVDVYIGLDGLRTHTIEFRWPAPTLALVLRGLGDDLRLARSAVNLEAPVALGVRPDSLFAQQVAQLAHLFDREVLLDVTFEKKSDVGEQLEKALDRIPYRIGVIARTSTRVEERLRGLLAKQRLRLIGSKNAYGQGGDERAIPVVAVSASDPATFEQALGAVLNEARDKGTVVGLIDASDASLATLKGAVTEWREKGIHLVPVSKALVVTRLSGE